MEIVAPALFKFYYGYETALTVMNVGSVATDITVSYSDGLSASATNVQPGQSGQFFQFLEGHAAGWSGSAKVTSSAAPIMGVVNEENIAKTDGDWQYSHAASCPARWHGRPRRPGIPLPVVLIRRIFLIYG